MIAVGLVAELEGCTNTSLPAPFAPASEVLMRPPPPIRVNPAPVGVVAQLPPHRLRSVLIGGWPAYNTSGLPSPVPQKNNPSASDTVLVVVADGTW